MIGVIKSAFDTNLKLPVFELLMIFITTFLQMLPCNTSFHFVDAIALFCSSEPMYFKTLNFCLWSCTLEQILAYPIDTFLISCHHQNLKGNVKHILFRQNCETISSLEHELDIGQTSFEKLAYFVIIKFS